MAEVKVPNGPGRHVVAHTIANNGQTLDAFHVPAYCRLVAVQFPSGLDATALTFEGSYDGVTFAAVKDPSGVAVTVTVAASSYILMPDLFGIPHLKLVLGTQQSPSIVIGLVFESIPSSYWHSLAVLAAA